jgi:hypothetical protein
VPLYTRKTEGKDQKDALVRRRGTVIKNAPKGRILTNGLRKRPQQKNGFFGNWDFFVAAIAAWITNAILNLHIRLVPDGRTGTGIGGIARISQEGSSKKPSSLA